MSKKKCIGLSIPLSGEVLEYAKNIINDLDKKFNFKTYKSHKSRPHINLLSGTTENSKELISTSKRILSLKHDPTIKTLGLGMFISKFPVIYLRFEKNDCLNFLRNSLLKTIHMWSDIRHSAQETMWIPKSTLLLKDMKINQTNEVLKFLNSKKLPSTMQIEEISVTDFCRSKSEDNPEIEIDNFKINKI